MSGDEAEGGTREETGVQVKLEEELKRVLVRLDFNGLKVVWEPTVEGISPEGEALSGEVKNDTIHIYEDDEEKALKVLRHEVLDHLVTSKIVKPMIDLVNVIIKSREAEIYREKEKIIEMFSKLLV